MKRFLVPLIGGLTAVTVASAGSLFALDKFGVLDLHASNVRVEFRNYDDTFLFAEEIPAGSTADYKGEIPTKPSDEEFDYTFSAWDKSLYTVVRDTIYHAEFQYSPRKYDVTFQNYNGKTLYIDKVYKGGTATYFGAVPTRESDEIYSYVFKGWDKPLENIQEDTIVTALFEPTATDFDVTFKNYDGTVLYVDHVAMGEAAVYRGIEPYKPRTEEYSYVFSGWDRAFDNIVAPITVTAQFTPVANEFSVTFLNYDESVLYVDHVPYGGNARYLAPTPTRPAEQGYVYMFTGWNHETTNITEDLTVIATFRYSEKGYKVYFYNYDDSFLYGTSVGHGEACYYKGQTPNKPADKAYTYTFSGWDRDISCITEDLTVYPIFDKELRTYMCTFVNYDGETLYACEVPYGGTAHYIGETPTRKADLFSAYEWIGWDNELGPIEGDTTFIAQFRKINGGGGVDDRFLVTFIDYDDRVLDYDLVKSGGRAQYEGPVPTRFGYDFYGWSEDFSCVEDDLLVFADYQSKWDPDYHEVTYRNLRGEKIYQENVHTGGTSVYRGEDYDYLSPVNGFLGWSKSLSNIRHPITVVPLMKKGGADNG